MIEEIHIRDLGVITDAVLPLGPGLTILSGETGAGKTMVVTALGMLLGRRADAGAVRVGAEKAVAEAVVNVPSDHAAVALVEDAGGDVDLEQDRASLQLSRTVAATGRSRAHVGGRSAPVARLGELGETLVAVHGQSDQLRLTSAAAQRHALDTFAAVHDTGSARGRKKAAESRGFEELLGEYRAALSSFEAVEAELSEIREKGRERALEAQSLRAALEEIDAVEHQSLKPTWLLRFFNYWGGRLGLGHKQEPPLALDGPSKQATELSLQDGPQNGVTGASTSVGLPADETRSHLLQRTFTA